MNGEIKKRFTAYRLSIGMILASEKKYDQARFRSVIFNEKDITRVNLVATVVDKYTSDAKPYAAVTLDDNTGSIRAKVFADSVPLLENIEIGDTVTVIGLIREFNDELYIVPEIVKSIDPRWLLARKFELINLHGSLYETTKGNSEVKAAPSQAEVNRLQGSRQMPSSPQIEQKSQVQPQSPQPNITEEKIEGITPEANPKTEESAEVKKDIKEEKSEPTLRDKILDMIQEAEDNGGINVEQIILSLDEPVDQINKEVKDLLEEGSIFEPKPGTLRIL